MSMIVHAVEQDADQQCADNDVSDTAFTAAQTHATKNDHQ